MTNDACLDLVKVLPEPAIIVTANGEVFFANPPFLKIIKTDLGNLIGKNLIQFSFTDEEKLGRYLQICTRSRQMIMGALNLRSCTGESIEFRCEGAVLKPAGELSSARIFLRFKPKEVADTRFTLLTDKIDKLNREILERRRAEEESQKLYLQAKEANRLKDEFLATISHELRTPLNVILGWAGLLRNSNLEGEVFAKALETIERNARSQANLVEDLLDVSRIITGKIRIDLRPIELPKVVEAAIETLRPTAENKSVRLEVILDPGAQVISGDAERLQQVIWNLLSNAIKFTPKDGLIEVRLEQTNSHVVLKVSDTGSGIEPDFLPFVFDRFRQADGSKSRQHGGLGLGLAITRHLVELHGGTVEAFSAGTNQGATFIIKLPVNLPGNDKNKPVDRLELIHQADFSEIENPEVQAFLKDLRVIIVDDETDAREFLRILLERYGAEVATAATVAEALDELQTATFDILISDIEMPGEDGYSLIRKVRTASDSKYVNIGAIALTAHARVADRLQLLTAGFDSHIAKPFDPAELIALIVGLARRTR